MTDKKRRRGHGEGSIYRRTDGRWCSVVDLGYINGKRVRKTVYGKTRKEVADKLPALLTAQKQGVALPTSQTKVSEFLTRWLEEAVKPTNAPTTYESYRMMVVNHISPMIGNHRLDKLTRSHVQQMLNAKTSAGLSPRTVQYIRAVLRTALNDAIKWELLTRNVAALAEPPRQTRDEVKPLTAEQVTALFDAVKDDRLEALYIVAGTLGLRRGESVGLRWIDIDFNQETISLRKQIQLVEGQPQLVDLKTRRSQRTLPMTEDVKRALRRRLEREHVDRTLAGSRWRGDEWGLVFPSTVGTPLNGSNLLLQIRTHYAAAGIPTDFDFKTLRHTAATVLAMKGVHSRIAMAILGHSQIATTMEIYSHAVDSSTRDAVNSVELAYQPKTTAKRPVLKRPRSIAPVVRQPRKKGV
jgi:integrase